MASKGVPDKSPTPKGPVPLGKIKVATNAEVESAVDLLGGGGANGKWAKAFDNIARSSLPPNVRCKPRTIDTKLFTVVKEVNGWVLQQHAVTKFLRLINPNGVRVAWGTESGMRRALSQLSSLARLKKSRLDAALSRSESNIAEALALITVIRATAEGKVLTCADSCIADTALWVSTASDAGDLIPDWPPCVQDNAGDVIVDDAAKSDAGGGGGTDNGNGNDPPPLRPMPVAVRAGYSALTLTLMYKGDVVGSAAAPLLPGTATHSLELPANAGVTIHLRVRVSLRFGNAGDDVLLDLSPAELAVLPEKVFSAPSTTSAAADGDSDCEEENHVGSGAGGGKRTVVFPQPPSLTRSASQEADDTNDMVFEIIDHSMVSPFERLCGGLEKLLSTWDVCSQKGIFHQGEVEGWTIVYHRVPLTPARAPIEGMDKLTAHYRTLIQRWFGLVEFIVVRSASGAMVGVNEGTALISMLATTMDSMHLRIPAFVTLHKPGRGAFFGYKIGKRHSTRYEADSLSTVPRGVDCLRGAVQYLQFCMEKHMHRGVVTARDDVAIAAHCSYARTVWRDCDWHGVSSAERACVSEMPWGSYNDPIEQLSLDVFWEWIPLSELLDLLGRTGDETARLDGLKAAIWTTRCSFSDSSMCRLALAIEGLTTCWLSARNKELLAQLGTPSSAPDARIHAAVMDIFPSEALPQSAHEPTDDERDTLRSAQIKGSPPGSLVALLAKHFVTLPTAASMAMLWMEFLREVRWHWDNAVTIARLAATLPDFSCCLIHQKLQLINLCIERQKRVIEEEAFEGARLCKQCDHEDGAVCQIHGNVHAGAATVAASVKAVVIGEMARGEGAGRLGEIAGLTLLDHPDRPMYEPRLQEHMIMTEDELRQQQNLLYQLGTSTEAAAIRAQMQSAGLNSDMAAFKAANPDCVLEDFIRWHSPRDWCPVSPHAGDSDSSDDEHQHGNDVKQEVATHVSPRETTGASGGRTDPESAVEVPVRSGASPVHDLTKADSANTESTLGDDGVATKVPSPSGVNDAGVGCAWSRTSSDPYEMTVTSPTQEDGNITDDDDDGKPSVPVPKAIASAAAIQSQFLRAEDTGNGNTGDGSTGNGNTGDGSTGNGNTGVMRSGKSVEAEAEDDSDGHSFVSAAESLPSRGDTPVAQATTQATTLTSESIHELEDDRVDEQDNDIDRIASNATVTKDDGETPIASDAAVVGHQAGATPHTFAPPPQRDWRRRWVASATGGAAKGGGLVAQTSAEKKVMRERTKRWGGRLSRRMRAPGNIWQTTWDSCEALPAPLQKPLFDHTKAAETALHDLETIAPSALFEQILMCASVQSLHTLRHSAGAKLPECKVHVDNLQQSINEMHPNDGEALDSERVRAFGKVLATTETIVARYTTLCTKLPDHHKLVHQLVTSTPPPITGEPTRTALASVFGSSARLDQVHPDDMEYVMRHRSKAQNGTELEQRMFVTVRQGGLRYAMAVASPD